MDKDKLDKLIEENDFNPIKIGVAILIQQGYVVEEFKMNGEGGIYVSKDNKMLYHLDYKL